MQLSAAMKDWVSDIEIREDKDEKEKERMREFAGATGAALTNPESILDYFLRSCRDQSRN